MLINNHQLHIETHGPEDGHPVLLLHHGLGSTQAWRRQVPALLKAGFRVIVYDRWGYGQSESRPHLRYSLKDDLADLQAILAWCQASRVSLIGHSDGGTIALYWAAQHPQQVSALVTVAAHIYLEPKMESGVQHIRAAFEHDARFRDGLRRVHGENFESVFRNWFDGWHSPQALDWDMRLMLSQIICPTLVIQGQQDEHATPHHASDIAASIVDAELWQVPNANHMLPQEMPEQFNSKVTQFLKHKS